MLRDRFRFVLGALVLMAGASFAPRSAAADPWTVDDILLAERPTELAVSPDGSAVAWIRRRMDADEGKRVGNLMLTVPGAEPVEIPLTRDRERDGSPRWSPDGRLIAFLSDRKLPEAKDEAGKPEDTQVWLIRARGGEPWPLTRLDREIRDLAWRDDGTLVIAAAEAKSLYHREIEKREDTSEVVDDARTPPVRLFAVDVEGGDITRLTGNVDWIDWFRISPDGRAAAALHQRSLTFEYDNRVPPDLRLVDLATGTSRSVYGHRRVLPVSVAWTPDGKGLYVVRMESSDPFYFTATITVVDYVDAATGTVVPIDLAWDRAVQDGEGVIALDDGFLTLLSDGVHVRPARYVRRGARFERRDLGGDGLANLVTWSASRDGAVVVYERSTAETPMQLYAARLNGTKLGAPRLLTKLNPSFAKKPVNRAEIVHWTGARGDDVEGILYYPFDWEAGRRYPLMLSIHGGPTGTDMDRWEQDWAAPKLLLAQRGAFVLEVNYHGSLGYGLEWAESICCGKYYELERVDLENGVDMAIERGLADPERLGTMGWSNGAILTTDLVTHSTRYKVASAGAGDVEWISDWANVDFGASFDNYYFGGAPYENPERYLEKSPYLLLKDVTTPTILFTGTEDRNVPPSQSWEHFRVLQQATTTPVRFLLFPGEPHGLREYAHQKRKLEEDLAWIDRYLFGKAPEEKPMADDAPLALALARQGFARVGEAYGTTVNGVLVPESVTVDGVTMSRFEITRAQFAAFDPTFPVEPGTGNRPVAGVSFERAREYAAWLARVTGEPWTLPEAGRVRDLYDAADADENTLDRWAGYPPNPEDAARLLERAAALGSPAPLLEEVGRHAGRGDAAKAYDLGGNVAEWAIGPDGAGVPLGGSADRPAGATTPPGEAYRGFRVVRGLPGGE